MTQHEFSREEDVEFDVKEDKSFSPVEVVRSNDNDICNSRSEQGSQLLLSPGSFNSPLTSGFGAGTKKRLATTS
eukprot:625735-Ditylum_brightwellii.AAC.1